MTNSNEQFFWTHTLLKAFILFFYIFAGVMCPQAWAKIREDNVGTTFKVTGVVVLPPPCSVNNDKPVTVEFDSVRTDLIDGMTYDLRAIPVAISCTGTPTGQLMLSLKGAATSDGTLETSVKGLGIRIRRDNSDFPLNEWINVSSGETFTLMAVPDKVNNAVLPTGEFTASATLVIKQE